MRTDQHHATSSSHIRPLTLGSGATGHTEDGSPGRFDETGRLTEQRTDAIVKALVKLKIGDRASCGLFVRAMEYQLRDFRRALAEEASTAPPQPMPEHRATASAAPALNAVARKANELAELLEALPDGLVPGLLQNLEAQDEMRRGYDPRYLDRLRIESLRLAAACGTGIVDAGSGAPVAQVQPPAMSPATVDFVASLGNMYEECFEKRPTADPDGPFARALGELGAGIGIELAGDQTMLEAALAGT